MAVRILVITVALVIGCGEVLTRRVSVYAQTALTTVQELYASARYEEALRALEHAEPSVRESLDATEYRVLCLLALGNQPAADSELIGLFARYPAYRPDPERVAPGIRAHVAAVRARVFPQFVRDQFAAAKARFDAKEYPAALAQFDAVSRLLEQAGDYSWTTDYQALVRGYRALASELLRPDTQLPVARSFARLSEAIDGDEAAASPSSVRVYDASAADVVPPFPLKPILPPVVSELSRAPARPGVFELLIDDEGRVESASVRRSITPQYDRLVLRESRNWRYQPATRNGEAVWFLKVLEIYSAPINLQLLD